MYPQYNNKKNKVYFFKKKSEGNGKKKIQF
jgi:hypothetical protein